MLYIEIVDVLLKHDALVKTKNSDGWIPLDEAVSYGNREMSKTTRLLYSTRIRITKVIYRNIYKY